MVDSWNHPEQRSEEVLFFCKTMGAAAALPQQQVIHWVTVVAAFRADSAVDLDS